MTSKNTGSFGHQIERTDKYSFTVSWVTSNAKMPGSLHVKERRIFRRADEVEAARFAKRWGLVVPEETAKRAAAK
jgi:hypothetical protein